MKCYQGMKMNRVLNNLLLLFLLCSCSSDEAAIAGELKPEYGEYEELMQNVPSCGDSQISFMHISDAHGSDISIKPMVYALNHINCDFAIVTGDILPSDSTISLMASSENPILPVIGNHDAYDHFGQKGFRENIINKMEIPGIVFGDENACYYHIDFQKNGYSLRVICLDQYEIDTEGPPESKHFSVISQKQIDWFVKLLEESGEFSSVIILMHQGFGNTSKGMRNKDNTNGFISIYAKDYPRGYYHMGSNDPFMIPDIVNAYITGNNMSDTKYYTGYKKGKLVVTTHFNKPNGNFVGFFGGHIHMDLVEYLPCYDSQLQVLMAYSGKGTGSPWNDLIKTETGKQSYNINYTAIDFKEHKLAIKRLGATQKADGTTRDSISFPITQNTAAIRPVTSDTPTVPTYDAQGRRVAEPRRGTFIKHGRKNVK